MKKLWLVINTASGSTSAAIVAKFEASCADYTIVGRTLFPDKMLPGSAQLLAVDADTLVVFGGDGTINAATGKVDDWTGACLVLPGGTMNGLAKALHGNASWTVILERVAGGTTERIPVAFCGRHRAMVGVILGPAASWFHARECVRSGAWSKLTRALRFAARKTFARTIRVIGDGSRMERHRAVIITPTSGDLEVATISTRSWFAAARLGIEWLAGNWRTASDVRVTRVSSVTCSSSRTVSALFDGEPVKLPSPVTVGHALTNLRFIATRP